MKAFDPNTDDYDWTAYVERLESFFVANEIKDEKKVSVLVTFLGVRLMNYYGQSLLWQNQLVRITTN